MKDGGTVQLGLALTVVTIFRLSSYWCWCYQQPTAKAGLKRPVATETDSGASKEEEEKEEKPKKERYSTNQ